MFGPRFPSLLAPVSLPTEWSQEVGTLYERFCSYASVTNLGIYVKKKKVFSMIKIHKILRVDL